MRMEPDSTFRARVPIHELRSRITPNSDIFVLAHFGVPRIDQKDWRLHISGLVSRPCAMTLDDVRSFPRCEVEAFIKCAGFPADHRIATRNASNGVWAGARLADVMKSVGLSSHASHLWFTAPDHGRYLDWSAHQYTKVVTVEHVLRSDILLAYEVNGEALTPEHGFPLRVLVPGFYGTNSVKWLCRIEAADRRAPGVFTNELYNDPVLDAEGHEVGRVPVWGAAPEALIVHPPMHAKLAAGNVRVSGWCWGEHPITRVDVSIDGGATWVPASVDQRHQMSWQAFELDIPIQRIGARAIRARATDATGTTQPLAEGRNSVHEVRITVIAAGAP